MTTVSSSDASNSYAPFYLNSYMTLLNEASVHIAILLQFKIHLIHSCMVTFYDNELIFPEFRKNSAAH